MSDLYVYQTATLDATGKYRYLLTRSWDPAKGTVLFIMLNPSTADADVDDPTIRRCLQFAQDLGYGELEVINLYAYRATDPVDLWVADDPIGRENDTFIKDAANRADRIIAAWGAHARESRVIPVLKMINSHPIYTLGFTKGGQPRHPLMLKKITVPELWVREAA